MDSKVKITADAQELSKVLQNLPIDNIVKAADLIAISILAGNKVMVCGNGGSAADAEHFAAEFEGRFRIKRKGLKCMALTANSATLTALGNDFGFNNIFSRLVEAHANPNDVLISLTTSGKSENINWAIYSARAMLAHNILITSSKCPAEMRRYYGVLPIVVESKDTPRIQEAHQFILHSICDIVDDYLEATQG